MQPENTGGEIPLYIRILSMGKLTYYGSCSSVFWVMCFLWPGNIFLWWRGGGGGICFMGCFKGYLNSLENRKK